MSNPTTEKPLIASDLSQFTGSENYYRGPFGLILTDGTKYLADRAGAYWLFDAIASHIMTNPKLRRGRLGDLQFWKLEVHDGNKATLTCRADSGEEPAVTQEIEYTDFPLPSVDIWVGRDERGRVAYLPSEH